MRPKPPCYGCKDREPTCHSTCERYLEYREALNKEKERVQKERLKDDRIRQYSRRDMV